MAESDYKHKDVFCAYLDVLGYTSMESSTTRSDILDFLRDKITESFNSNKTMNTGAEKFGLDVDQTLIHMKVVQDGILIYTTDSSIKSFDTIVLKCVNFLIFFNSVSKIPIRGVITRGDLYFDDSTDNFVIRGDAWDKASTLDKALDWMGVTLTLSVVLSDINDRIRELVERLLIVGEVKDHPNEDLNLKLPIKREFEDKFKSGSIQTAYALNWQWLFNTSSASLNWWSGMAIEIPSNSTVGLKKENTARFLNHCNYLKESSRLFYHSYIKKIFHPIY